MVLDKHDDLVVCDQISKSVDIIDPPYKRITRAPGSGYSDPYDVSIDEKNNQAYVTEIGTKTIDVVTYPGGSLVATLGRRMDLRTRSAPFTPPTTSPSAVGPFVSAHDRSVVGIHTGRDVIPTENRRAPDVSRDLWNAHADVSRKALKHDGECHTSTLAGEFDAPVV
jgi:DNA-binding beta-propeller fold protein YncE